VNRATHTRRVTGWLLVAALAAITGVVSYLHALWVVRYVGNEGVVAYLVPCVPDLMIVTSSLTLLEGARAKGDQDARPWMAMLSLGIGVVVTVAMNVAAGWHQGWGGALIAGLIPVAFVLTFETLLVLVRIWQHAPLTDEPAACGHKVATSLDEALAAAAAVMSQRQVAEAFGVHRNRVGRAVRGLAPELVPVSMNGDTPDE